MRCTGKPCRHDGLKPAANRGCQALHSVYRQRIIFRHKHAGRSEAVEAETMTKRAVLYLRVSTDGQTIENQRLVLAEVAGRRGWPLVATYDDQGLSGSGAREKRPGFDRMLKDAGRRRFDILMVAAIDRLGRSTATVSTALADLTNAGNRDLQPS